MNAIFQTTTQSPASTSATTTQAAPQQSPFHLIGTHRASPEALARFNHVLLGLGRVPMRPVELAIAARRLAGASTHGQPSEWIVRRMRRGLTIGLMLADPAWQPSGQCGELAGIVVDYLRCSDDLIPDDVPRFGRLDDALVVDAAWPRLADEARDYLDFCRIRRVEASLRGCNETQFAFSREDWQQARDAEAGLLAHRRKVGLRSYLPEAPRTAGFRVC